MNASTLQRRLVAHGYPVDVDGEIGPKTKAALSKFQKAVGLAGSGIPGPKTYAALEKPPRVHEPASLPKYMQVAAGYLGTKETPGSANNPAVVEMFKLSEHPQITQDSVPWCAAFVAACLAKGKVPNEVAKSLRLWAAAYGQLGVKLTKPVWGCVGVKTRNGGGHVGFVVAANEKTIWLLGGNQGDKVSVAGFPRSSFTSFRMPTGIDPKSMPPLPSSAAGAMNPSQS